ncbi:MAG: hypothetical protein NTW19_03855 [Planctomycetota bacterium]|nr:hypothetical protein [Planctomycetota bacterium]
MGPSVTARHNDLSVTRKIILASLVLMLLLAHATSAGDQPEWKDTRAATAEAVYAKATKDAEDQFRRAKLVAAQAYIRSLKQAAISVAKSGDTDEMGKLSTRIKETENAIQQLQAGEASTFFMVFTIQTTSVWVSLGFPDRKWEIVDALPSGTKIDLSDPDHRGSVRFDPKVTTTIKVKFDVKPANATPLVIEQGYGASTTVKAQYVGEKTDVTFINGGGSGDTGYNTKKFDGVIKPNQFKD